LGKTPEVEKIRRVIKMARLMVLGLLLIMPTSVLSSEKNMHKISGEAKVHTLKTKGIFRLEGPN
jgi:hypothetical protein